LLGHEVKAVKNGQINLKGSYVTIKHQPKPEVFLTNANIARYKKAGPLPDYDPQRSRKLLLHKSQIKSLIGKLQQKGLTLVPLKVYTKKNRVKLEFGIGRGKQKHDKRESIKKREIDRDIRRTLKTQR
jgi:SsrA-binding protein